MRNGSAKGKNDEFMMLFLVLLSDHNVLWEHPIVTFYYVTTYTKFLLTYLFVLVFFVTTTTSRAVTVSTRGCTYRLPGSFRQFPLRGSIYADPADIQMLRLVLGSPAGGLGIHGSDGRSVPLVGPKLSPSNTGLRQK